MPKAIIVSSTDHYAHRLSVVEDALHRRGFETLILTTDFTHFGKKYYTLSRPGAEQAHATPYHKNLSIARLRSHAVFARNAFRRVAEDAPELVYVLVPPNSLARRAAMYKKKSGATLIFDLFDMWPEAFPYRKNPVLQLGFKLWAALRDRNLRFADQIVSECALFGERLQKPLAGRKPIVVPVALADTGLSRGCEWDEDVVNLLYLGSVNNIIDIEGTQRVLRDIARLKPARLHCICSGERDKEFYAAAREAGAQVIAHGEIYDEQKKQAVMNVCRFGLNLLRPGVCVGLTMKSVDYLRGGLPVISNVLGDTARLIASDGIGLDAEAASRAALMTEEENRAFRARALDCYYARFTPEAAGRALDSAL